MENETAPAELKVRAQFDEASIKPDKTGELHLVVELLAAGRPVDGQRPALNVAFVIDASGSMSGEPLLHVQRSMRVLLELLSEQDRVAVVAFSDRATEVAPLTTLSPDARRLLTRRVEAVAARGGTNIEEGLKLGKQLLGTRQLHERQLIVLLSDGQPTSGATTQDQFSNLIDDWRADASVTALGYGPSHAIDLMNGIATAGGGSYWYIADPDEARVEFARAMGAQGDIVADGIEVALLPEDGVEVVEVFDKKPRFTKSGIVVSAPDLRQDAKHNIVARLRIDPRREVGPFAPLLVRVKHRIGGKDTFVEASTKLVVSNDEVMPNQEAYNVVLLAMAERVRRESRQRADQGNFDGAAFGLRRMVLRLQAQPDYKAMDGSSLSEAVEQLIDEATAYERKPSAEQYAEFKASNMAIDLAQGGQHAADVKMISHESQRLMAAVQGTAVDGEVILRLNGQEQRLPLRSDMTIGRVLHNDIVIASGNVSKRHTRMVVRDGHVIVIDLKSTNGTRVNGKHLSRPHTLRAGEKVQVGDAEIQVEIKGPRS